VSEARVFCKKAGMQLAELKTEAERDFVLEKLNSGYPFDGVAPFKSLWIDGSKSANSNKWIWTKSGEEIKYEIPWVPNESFNKLGDEYCLNLIKYTDGNGNKKFGFNDDPCNRRRENFLCQLGQLGLTSNDYIVSTINDYDNYDENFYDNRADYKLD
jgi:hypothetical protein